MDILSGLANILGQSGSQGGQQPDRQQGGMGDLGALGGLISMLGGASGTGASATSGAAAGGGDALGGLGSLIGALFSGKGGASSAGAAGSGGLGGLGQLLGSLMSSGGGNVLNQLLGGSEPPPAPMASQPTGENRAINLLRALVYAAKADGKIDDREKAMLTQQIQKSGIGPQAQQYVNEFLSEDLDPNKIARNITSPEEALQIYALSCAITNMDQFMERNYLTALAQALRIPENARVAIEQKIAG